VRNLRRSSARRHAETDSQRGNARADDRSHVPPRPDDSGTFVAPGVAFGSRLSIVDVARAPAFASGTATSGDAERRALQPRPGAHELEQGPPVQTAAYGSSHLYEQHGDASRSCCAGCSASRLGRAGGGPCSRDRLGIAALLRGLRRRARVRVRLKSLLASGPSTARRLRAIDAYPRSASSRHRRPAGRRVRSPPATVWSSRRRCGSRLVALSGTSCLAGVCGPEEAEASRRARGVGRLRLMSDVRSATLGGGLTRADRRPWRGT
jgi:hypothetical protein